MAAAMSTAIGPILGGVLTDTLGWRYIFWLNAPVGVLALLMTYRYLPESRDPDAASFDVPGQTLAMLGLGTLTIVLVEGRTHGTRVDRRAGRRRRRRHRRVPAEPAARDSIRCCRWTCSAAAGSSPR